ncbi:hypothetical protein J6590_025854 [Homalodisca vitripennis]|nr:hypothetical protein J6590_025854 [Homalodisca vitripennis]
MVPLYTCSYPDVSEEFSESPTAALEALAELEVLPFSDEARHEPRSTSVSIDADFVVTLQTNDQSHVRKLCFGSAGCRLSSVFIAEVNR